MRSADLEAAIRRWTRLGVNFGGPRSRELPDIERLLLDTARLAPAMPRLFIMAATWLHRYGELVAKHRLKRLVREELGAEHRAALGLLLDIAQRGTHPPRFASIIRGLTPAAEPHPLFDVERANTRLRDRALRRASKTSLRWGLWCEDFEFKNDALRPASWVVQPNPRLIARADFQGDLRASVMAALEFDHDAGTSELNLARRSGGSRAQVRNALDRLELTGRVKRTRPTSTSGHRRTSIALAAAG